MYIAFGRFVFDINSSLKSIYTCVVRKCLTGDIIIDQTFDHRFRVAVHDIIFYESIIRFVDIFEQIAQKDFALSFLVQIIHRKVFIGIGFELKRRTFFDLAGYMFQADLCIFNIFGFDKHYKISTVLLPVVRNESCYQSISSCPYPRQKRFLCISILDATTLQVFVQVVSVIIPCSFLPCDSPILIAAGISVEGG